MSQEGQKLSISIRLVPGLKNISIHLEHTTNSSETVQKSVQPPAMYNVLSFSFLLAQYMFCLFLGGVWENLVVWFKLEVALIQGKFNILTFSTVLCDENE